ncbi:peptidyl-tRNA hydrolase [Shewanella sp. phage 1/4]|uniref:peptidyl-tRNA hydrolase n=1 Tax=Shewanella phage 1/4 TaxID=1458859 RepID=UPI0004F8211E|nr:peptidyl-tRNA hydrolase [Shewanella sp. phage 1/4]AHK11201.1 peptidyl-tRNA hydrolase [Shewanella sp. phage 1/4]
MIIKCYYDKTLKMSAGKLAAQVGHVVANMVTNLAPSKIIVLEASHNKFIGLCKDSEYVQHDVGLTEVVEGTPTVCGYTYNNLGNTIHTDGGFGCVEDFQSEYMSVFNVKEDL